MWLCVVVEVVVCRWRHYGGEVALRWWRHCGDGGVEVVDCGDGGGVEATAAVSALVIDRSGFLPFRV
jgi:hypothetical protein